MFSRKISFFPVMLLLIAAVSCSGGGSDILLPTADEDRTVSRSSSGTACAGLWRISIDTLAGRAEIIQPRTVAYMLNVLGFLEPPAMMWLSIDHDTLVIKPAQKFVGVDVILKHPLTSPRFTGFDVRGIVFGPEVINADGYTVAMSPEFFSDAPYGYTDGMLGTPNGEIGFTGLAGYKYFADNLGLADVLSEYFADPVNIENRGVFSTGAQNARHYELSWEKSQPPVNYLVFNYAVYANFGYPSGVPPYELDDFDILTVNSADAFCLSSEEMLNTMWYLDGQYGGSLSLDVEIFDWQLDTAGVTIEAPGVIPLTPGEYQGLGTTFKSFRFTFGTIPATPIQSGPLEVSIIVTDTKSFGEVWFGGLLPAEHPMYNIPVYTKFIHTAIVSDIPEPCSMMGPITDYKAHILPDFPWQYMTPGDTGLVCTRDPNKERFIIGSALKYYPVSWPTIGAFPADAEDPTDPTVMFPTPYMITADVICDTKNRIYTVADTDPMTLILTLFSGTDFSEPVSIHTFDGNIVRLAIDGDDHPIVLTKSLDTEDHTIYHYDGLDWNAIPVDDSIVLAGIQDFDFNPLLDHYVFVCSDDVDVQLIAQDADGVIHYTDNDLFGVQAQVFVPTIYIDPDSPDCHIVCWGTLDSEDTTSRPIVRYSALDYNIPKVVSSLTGSANGASSHGGAWAPGTNKLYLPGYNNSVGEITLPPDW